MRLGSASPTEEEKKQFGLLRFRPNGQLFEGW
jgi:hypothetical protein